MILSYSEKRFEEAINYVAEPLYSALQQLPSEIKTGVHEIRLRAGRPLSITLADKCLFVNSNGQASTDMSKAIFVSINDIEVTFSYLCEMSVYSYAKEISEGFITLKGGHRAGICGKAIVEGGKITGLKDISSINIRVAREILGCANEIIPHILNGRNIEGCIIASPPGGGKTTILRDISRMLSNSGFKVCVIDERGEIGAVFEGVPQNDIGAFCDVLDGYPKDKGIMQALRSLSPDVIICDEIGDEKDTQALISGMNAGVPVIATAHAKTFEEAKRRPQINKLLETRAVNTFILLHGRENPSKIKNVYKTGETKNEDNRSFNNIFGSDIRGIL